MNILSQDFFAKPLFQTLSLGHSLSTLDKENAILTVGFTFQAAKWTFYLEVCQDYF